MFLYVPCFLISIALFFLLILFQDYMQAHLRRDHQMHYPCLVDLILQDQRTDHRHNQFILHLVHQIDYYHQDSQLKPFYQLLFSAISHILSKVKIYQYFLLSQLHQNHISLYDMPHPEGYFEVLNLGVKYSYCVDILMPILFLQSCIDMFQQVMV